MMYVLLILGFILLIKGADLFVDGASSIAGILRIPPVIIGLTIVAMGTSAPEAAVSITAGLGGNSDISLGNIVGSNIFNLLVVIGVSAIISSIDSEHDILHRDLWWNLGVTILLLILSIDGRLSRIDGVILLCGIVSYIFILIKSALKNRTSDDSAKKMSVSKSSVFIILGLGAIILGGNFVVDNASLIAAKLGMSDTLIGLTIVAIGTSLPELVTSIVAAKKGQSEIALGNAIGSCIFNILFILGIASLLSPINVVSQLIIDMIILIAVCIIIFICVKTKNKTIRIEGIICVSLYVIYTAYIILR